MSQAVRERIIREATRLFVEHGYRGISMREIAEAANVSKAGLYYHFRDKEDLFLAVLGDSLQRIGWIIAEAVKEKEATRERVAHVMRGIFSLPAEQRAIIRLATQEMAHLRAPTRKVFGEQYHRLFITPLEDILKEGIARQEIRPLNTRVAIWMLLGMVYPFLYPPHHQGRIDPDEMLSTALTIFFDGVSLPPNHS